MCRELRVKHETDAMIRFVLVRFTAKATSSESLRVSPEAVMQMADEVGLGICICAASLRALSSSGAWESNFSKTRGEIPKLLNLNDAEIAP